MAVHGTPKPKDRQLMTTGILTILLFAPIIVKKGVTQDVIVDFRLIYHDFVDDVNCEKVCQI